MDIVRGFYVCAWLLWPVRPISSSMFDVLRISAVSLGLGSCKGHSHVKNTQLPQLPGLHALCRDTLQRCIWPWVRTPLGVCERLVTRSCRLSRALCQNTRQCADALVSFHSCRGGRPMPSRFSFLDLCLFSITGTLAALLPAMQCWRR